MRQVSLPGNPRFTLPASHCTPASSAGMRCPLHDGRCRSTIPQLDAAILPSRCQQGLLLAVILVPGQSCDVATWVGAITPACRSPHLQVVQEDGPLPVPGCRRQSCHAQLQHRGAMGLQPLHHPAGSGIPGGYSCVIGRTDQQPWLYWHHLQLRRRASMARQLPACHAALPPQADPGIHAPRSHRAIWQVAHCCNPLSVACLGTKRPRPLAPSQVHDIQSMVSAAKDNLACLPVHAGAQDVARGQADGRAGRPAAAGRAGMAQCCGTTGGLVSAAVLGWSPSKACM